MAKMKDKSLDMPYYMAYKRSDTVAIVGFAESSRHLAPFHDESKEIWGLNEAYKHLDKKTKMPWMKRWDQWFQLHPMWDFMRANNRNDPGHWDWLEQPHDFPIWMQYEHREVPSSVRFPIEDAMRLFGCYFTSSFSYMMALAILMGYKRIEVFGFDMAAEGEYGYQKAGAEYLIGFAKGLGIDVYLPPKSPLVRGNMYAYEDLRAADRTTFGLRKLSLEPVLRDRTETMHRWQGRLDELEDLLKSPEIPMELKRHLGGEMVLRQQEHKEKISAASAVSGAIDELKNLIHWHDSQNIPADRAEPDQPKEVANEQASS